MHRRTLSGVWTCDIPMRGDSRGWSLTDRILVNPGETLSLSIYYYRCRNSHVAGRRIQSTASLYIIMDIVITINHSERNGTEDTVRVVCDKGAHCIYRYMFISLRTPRQATGTYTTRGKPRSQNSRLDSKQPSWDKLEYNWN